MPIDEETKKQISDYVDRRNDAMRHWSRTCIEKNVNGDLKKLVEEQINLSFIDDMVSLYTINLKEKRYISHRCEIANYYVTNLVELGFARNEVIDIMCYGGFL